MHFTTYLVLFGMMLDFKPDIIIELGRGPGNSTFVFNRYCQLHRECEFHSFGLEDWDREIAILSEKFAEFDTSHINLHHMDLRLFDYETIINSDKRCVVFFDAHGYDATDATFSLIFPLLKDRQHLIVVDDIWDGRYDYQTDVGGRPNSAKWSNRGYHGKSLWNGPKLPITSTIRLGHLESLYEEVVLLYDFACRNNLPVHTFRHAFEMWRTEEPEEYETFNSAMEDLVNPDEEYLVYLSLDEADIAELTFPEPSEGLLVDRANARNQSDSEVSAVPVAEKKSGSSHLIVRIIRRAVRIAKHIAKTPWA